MGSTQVLYYVLSASNYKIKVFKSQPFFLEFKETIM